ncbi:MAG: hypothetical protein KatS3mg087_2137 [Patescibacteria group bacterium]|nr:MAG: hypothetical protein KatS3mg087_2137 [Patescibacteria group bacterium]
MRALEGLSQVPKVIPFPPAPPLSLVVGPKEALNKISVWAGGDCPFLLTIWFSRGDKDMLMASGAFISPHVIFYNLLPITPAIARLRSRAAAIALLLSFLTLSSNWFGPLGWWLGWGFVPWVWINLAAQRYPNSRYLRWLRVING